MNTEWIVGVSVLAGCALFYAIGRHASLVSKYFFQILILIPFVSIILLPSVILVLPFLGRNTVSVPVTVESVERYRGGNTSYRPGTHGRYVEVGFESVELSTDVEGRRVRDEWVVPIGFGPFVEGQTLDGIMADNGENPRLAVRSVIRFPFTFGQLLLSLIPGALLFLMLADFMHKKRSSNAVK